MDELQTDGLFRQLRSRESREAWARFLDLYSPLLLDVVRLFERDDDAVGDCYLFICEQLSRDGFKRLLHFRPDGPARFSTWLCAVARNLCLDWHRREFGRHRVFESVARLPALDQEIFRCVFVDRLPVEDSFLKLAPRFPGLTVEQVSDGLGRIQQALTSRQRWLLMAQRSRGFRGTGKVLEQDEAELTQIPSEMPNPETWAGLQEERASLLRAMSKLSSCERLLIRLRYEREATLEEIASLFGLGSAQSADRRIREVVEKLRKEMP